MERAATPSMYGDSSGAHLFITTSDKYQPISGYILLYGWGFYCSKAESHSPKYLEGTGLVKAGLQGPVLSIRNTTKKHTLP